MEITFSSPANMFRKITVSTAPPLAPSPTRASTPVRSFALLMAAAVRLATVASGEPSGIETEMETPFREKEKLVPVPSGVSPVAGLPL